MGTLYILIMTEPVRNSRVAIRWLIVSVSVLILLGCGTVPATEETASHVPVPDPTLSPGEVVAIQMEALGGAYPDSDGIEVAFRFASPANKASTGPLPRFAGMIRGPAYDIMLDYDSVYYGPVLVQGRVAFQQVILVRGEERALFVFQLRRQDTDPYQDCWMTDGVFRLETVPSPTYQFPDTLTV